MSGNCNSRQHLPAPVQAADPLCNHRGYAFDTKAVRDWKLYSSAPLKPRCDDVALNVTQHWSERVDIAL